MGNGKLLAGAMYRTEQSADTNMIFDIRFGIPGLGTIPFNGESLLVPFYDPALAALAVGYRTKDYEIHIGSEINYWSGYRPPIIVLTGNINELTANPFEINPVVLQDTYSYRLGGEFKDIFSSDSFPLSVRTGLEYHTSALPDNADNLAVVDSERWGLALGFGFDISTIPGVIDQAFSLNATAKYTELIEKTLVKKMDNGDTQTVNIGGSVTAFFMGVDFEF